MRLVKDQKSMREVRVAVVVMVDLMTDADLTEAAARIGIETVTVIVPNPGTGDHQVGGVEMIGGVEIVNRSSVVNGPPGDDSKQLRLPRPIVSRVRLGRATGTTCTIKTPRSFHAACSRMLASSATRRNQMRNC